MSMRLTLRLARRVKSLLDNQQYRILDETAKILRTDPHKLLNNSLRYLKNAKRKGLNTSPIKEPSRYWGPRRKQKSEYDVLLYDRGQGKKQIFNKRIPGEHDWLQSRGETRRDITGSGPESMADYLVKLGYL